MIKPRDPDAEAALEADDIALEVFIHALKLRHGYDFSEYSRASLKRRALELTRKFGVERLGDLIPSTLYEPALVREIVSHLSVPVSSLFRDPEVFLRLREEVLPMLASWPRINIWLAGCAYGEEVYSLAIMLAEAERQLGGRVSRESRLPGLAEWARVRDWRIGQIDQLERVEVFPESRLTAADVVELAPSQVIIATGSVWAADTIGRHSGTGLETVSPGATIISAEAVLDQQPIEAGHLIVYDDDHYYMGSVLALSLRERGHAVTLVTPAGKPCEFGVFTGEVYQSNARLFEAGVEVVTNTMIVGAGPGSVTTECSLSGRRGEMACDGLMPVTRRLPRLDLYDELRALQQSGEVPDDLRSADAVRRIGDAEAPNTIAAAVYAGYRAGVELGQTVDLAERFGRRDIRIPA